MHHFSFGPGRPHHYGVGDQHREDLSERLRDGLKDRLRWGGFGPGGFGPRERFGGRGPGGFGGPKGFAKGDLRLVVLSMIAEEPRHGYDIIKALGERSGGWYSPSPGSVYPLLQLLEDQGLVKVSESGGKKIYTVTDEGKAQVDEFMNARNQDFNSMFGGDHAQDSGDMRGLFDDMKSFFPLVGRLRGRSDAETVKQIRAVLQKARTDIQTILDTPPAVKV